MAKQTGLFKFTGKLDNVIGYRRNGVHFVRSMPDKVRQTAATRRAAREFGVASRKGRLIRRAVTPYLGRYDGTLVNRLNKALVLLRDRQLQGIERFRFNRHTGLDKIFPLLPVYTAEGVKIPAQELPYLGGASHLEVSVIATWINFAERRIVEVETVTEIVDLRHAFEGMTLAVPGSGNGTLIVTVQAQACSEYNGKLFPTRDRRYMAADIVRVVSPVAQRSVAKKSRPKKFAGRYTGKRNWNGGYAAVQQGSHNKQRHADYLPIIAGSSGGAAHGEMK